MDNFLEDSLFKREGGNETIARRISRIHRRYCFMFLMLVLRDGNNISRIFVFEWK